ncbi:lipase 1-like [Harmonia axyridis]|uniref:lipase 1-like n=1 Tax=Harmonia axyridis TaxID=115357 RepID=UPI001E277956|nr:lipase 1-like [Harmonia axyridis]
MGVFGLRLTASVVVIITAVVLLRRREKENVVLSSINESGYEGQLHHTITEDGYILGLHRILKQEEEEAEQSTKQPKERYPILFVHGLESSAIDWIHFQGKNSLPYLLLEEGYDVWLGNVRGTQASFNHTSVDPYEDPEKFWDTSIHEIGYYDLPAMVDYVLETSKSEKLFYVGISQGEATFLIMASSRPEYNKKIQLALLTSPSSHLRHSDNIVLKSLGSVWPVLQLGARVVGLHTVPGRQLFGTICQYEIFSLVCSKLYDPFTGYSDIEQSESLTVAKMFEVYPVKSSMKQLLHYLQMYNSGIFRRFDYGPEENLKKYGIRDPPEYDLNNVTAPVSYFWGENDCWSRPKDVEEIEKKLPNMVLNYRVPHKAFNHYDVFMAKDAKILAYEKMIETIIHHSHDKS